VAEKKIASRPAIDAKALIERLESVHGKARHIPRFDPMDELVSCIMSQHTTDANSFPAFTRLKEAFPEWQDVVDGGPEKLADVIRHAGLANSKAKYIVGSLREIKSRTGEYALDALRPMSTKDATSWLTSLPGVGHKTAAIVLCFAMGRDTIPVDTHIFRVAWRIGLVPEGVGEEKAHHILTEIVPGGLAFRLHMAFIQHGRLICRAPIPQCGACPVTECCQWFASGGPAARREELSESRIRPSPKSK
jgi:endonuclease-3